MKVLVAEDDELTRNGLRDVLEREGFEVLCAQDGVHALRLFADTNPDFVLLDIMMPRSSGYDVCREIRRTDPDTPIIFISAKSEEIDRVVGLELGADDFIVKPFGVREVVARIRAVARRCLRGRGAEDSLEEFSFGPHTVSPRELRATAGDQVIELSLREVSILRVLASRCGEAVSRWELYRECWGTEMPAESRTLDQHVAKLRKRVEEEPAQPKLIQTIHGFGYRYPG